ncbi:heavy metal-associated isoprenylated plant protein 43-like [Malania oleifera]|uniref:heavy metal-associated isoprenylated plant protein 43-like n=1 Tax=Malania oleifera TaxID=397392 RepID=UPI0025AE739D|nr:heavy metal-associated isoprenylated plant protein 43-like [Malania oleifera]
MVQRTVLKVNISCQKCQKRLLKAVSRLQGVDKIEVDSANGILTVTGDADPYDIIVLSRKACSYVEVVSIGPPPAPPKQDGPKKPEAPKPAEKKPEAPNPAAKKPEAPKPAEKKPDEYKPDQQAHFHNPLTYHYPLPQRIEVAQMGPWEEPNPSCSIM